MLNHITNINTISGKHKKKIWFGAIVLFFLQFYKVIPAFLVGLIANELAKNGYTDYCLHLAILIGFSWAFMSYLRLALKKKMNQTVASAVHESRVIGVKNVVSSAYGSSSGGQLAKLNSGLDNFRLYLSLLWNDYLGFIATIITSIIVLYKVDWKVVLILAFNVLSFIGLLKYTSNKIRSLLIQSKELKSKLNGITNELALNRLTIQSFGQAGIDSSSMLSNNTSNQLMLVEKEITKSSITQWQLFNLICAITMSLGIVCFIDNAKESPGILIWAFGCFSSAIMMCVGMLNNWEDVVRLSSEIEDSASLLKRSDKVEKSELKLKDSLGSLTVKDVNFGYQSQKLILNNINLKLSAGSWVGVMGASGSGKSTLIKIILGILKPNSGEILIDDIPLENLAGLIVGQELVVALQECEIFSTSLYDNITLGRELSNSQLNLILETTQLIEVKNRCGLKSPLGEKGVFISGGERQRLSMARSLVTNPSFLILDEATSQLDEATEEKILKAIKTNFPNIAVMMVTHHDRPLKFCDEVVRLEEGFGSQASVP